jgi:hypothetical protein
MFRPSDGIGAVFSASLAPSQGTNYRDISYEDNSSLVYCACCKYLRSPP